MIEWHPSIPFFAAAILALFASSRLRRTATLLAPFASFYLVHVLTSNGAWLHEFRLFQGAPLMHVRLDPLALFFIYAFLVFAFLAHVYSLHEKGRQIAVAANLYIGSSIGAAAAGDLVSLFIFWEIMALASAALVWNKERAGSFSALLRYILVHLTGGIFLFAGILIRFLNSGGLLFNSIDWDIAGMLIFLGFCVNAALVPFHAWLPDAYPESGPAAGVYLNAFTTKMAIYAFARGFAGSEWLIWLGVISAVYGVVFALMEDDMRKLLSYHIVCQIGYMACGIGIGSEAGINAASAHAAGNIIFKGLLFMAAGALIYRTGKHRLSELGNMACGNKLILFFFMAGAFAISGFPFLNGYVSKVLLLKAAGKAHMEWLELVFLLVAVGTFMSIALKLAYFAFWGEGHSRQAEFVRPCPSNMQWAMGGAAFLCVAAGLFPAFFYSRLPFEEYFAVYTPDHILHTVQLLAGTLLAFLLILNRLYAEPHVSLDADWFYRKGALLFVRQICRRLDGAQSFVQDSFANFVGQLDGGLKRYFPDQLISSVSRPLLFIVGAGLAAGLALLWLKQI